MAMAGQAPHLRSLPDPAPEPDGPGPTSAREPDRPVPWWKDAETEPSGPATSGQATSGRPPAGRPAGRPPAGRPPAGRPPAGRPPAGHRAGHRPAAAGHRPATSGQAERRARARRDDPARPADDGGGAVGAVRSALGVQCGGELGPHRRPSPRDSRGPAVNQEAPRLRPRPRLGARRSHRWRYQPGGCHVRLHAGPSRRGHRERDRLRIP